MRRTEQSRDAFRLRPAPRDYGAAGDSARHDRLSKAVWFEPLAGNEISIQYVDVQRSTAIDLSFGLIWEKMLPDRFVGIAGFASGILAPHIFQSHQGAILTGIGGANCAGNVCQPLRRRFFFEFLRCILPRPIQRIDVDEANAVEHIEHCA